jgi:hypothetical protein
MIIDFAYSLIAFLHLHSFLPVRSGYNVLARLYVKLFYIQFGIIHDVSLLQNIYFRQIESIKSKYFCISDRNCIIS